MDDAEADVKAFLYELEAVCRKHGMFLGPDGGGSLYISTFDEQDVEWMHNAFDLRP